MSVVVDQGGAQVLPNVGDERATVTAWQAHMSADADLRTVAPIYMELAAVLRVVAS